MFELTRDLNPGPLGEKRERYLCPPNLCKISFCHFIMLLSAKELTKTSKFHKIIAEIYWLKESEEIFRWSFFSHRAKLFFFKFFKVAKFSTKRIWRAAAISRNLKMKILKDKNYFFEKLAFLSFLGWKFEVGGPELFSHSLLQPQNRRILTIFNTSTRKFVLQFFVKTYFQKLHWKEFCPLFWTW